MFNICLLRRHLYTIQWHMTTLWYRSWLFGSFAMTPIAVMNRIFHSEMAVTARACGTCTQFKTKHQSKHQRVLPAYMALHKIVGYLTVIINVFGFYSHWRVWYKSEKAFGMCSKWHYTTRGLAYGDMTTSPDGLVVMSPSANLPRCVMAFWTHAHAFSLYKCSYIKNVLLETEHS